MKKYFLTFATVLCCTMALTGLTSCTIEDNPVNPTPDVSTTPFLDQLSQVENVISIEAFTPENDMVGFAECYKVFFSQPIDHENPSAGTMKQKALIFFKGFDRPTVMYTRGYDLPDHWKNSISNLDIAANMDANLVVVEHRYFGDSKNLSDTRWDFLTIEQAAADHHAIFQPLKQILPKEWISTGTSKDGMTSLFYRYFYPNDMTVTTVFCSPFMTSLYYKPVGTYLDSESGSDAEREHMHSICSRLLEGAQEGLFQTYLQMCDDYTAQLRALYHDEARQWFGTDWNNYIDGIGEYFFEQFSYHTAKERVNIFPPVDAEPKTLLDCIFFQNILQQNGLWHEDAPLIPPAPEEDYYWKADGSYPYTIQTVKQLGQYCHDFSRYESLIGEVEPPLVSTFLFDQDVWLCETYDNTRMKDIRENFIPSTDCPVMFYYAQGDPWTGARPDKINESRSMLLIGELGTHNHDINNPEHFSAEDCQQIMDFLARYVDYSNPTTSARRVRRQTGGNLPTFSIEPDRYMIRRSSK